VTAGAKTSLVLLLGTFTFLVLALAVVPMHVTLGAGSLRCGTVLSPDTESEIADLCPSARSGHLTAALVAGGALAVIAALPWFASSLLGRSARPLLAVWSVSWVIAAAVALLFLAWVVEYSPPHAVFDL
jgi:hypothetical protein